MQEINFFDHYQQQELEDKKLGPWALLISVSVLMVIGSGVLMYQTWQLNQQIVQLEQTLNDPQLQAQVAQAEQLTRELTALGELDAQLNQLTQAIDQRDASVTQQLLAISQVIPQTVTLDQTSFTAQTLMMTAQAVTRQAVAEFHHNLEALGLFREVYVSTIQQINGDGTNFQFQIQCVMGE